MHLELVDALRCIATHEETWLVASVDEWRGRQIVRGRLGCPICATSYPIEEGVADFRAASASGVDLLPHAPGADVRARASLGATPSTEGAGPGAAEERALRLAAQLDLREPGGIVLLSGPYADLVDALESVTAAHYVVVLAAADPAPPSGSGIRVAHRLPFASGAVRGAAIDGVLTPLLGQVVSVLRAGGRLVAPAAEAPPPAITELARDEVEWVGERLADVTPPMPLRRRAT